MQQLDFEANPNFTNAVTEKISMLEKETEQLKELNNIKNKLFSIIAHDLRTPMYGIKNLLNTLVSTKVPAEDLMLILPDIIHNINHTTSLMENLLLWSKSQMNGFQIKEELININEIMLEAQQLLMPHAKTKRIALEVVINKSIFIFADRNMISLVVRNLLNNAIKFTHFNGKIELLAEEVQNEIRVYVKDNGKGIQQEKLKDLFQTTCNSTLGTASEMGTGLGLLLCKEFVHKNGGEISVQSEEGKGSTFSFSLQNNSFCVLYLPQ